MRRLPAFAASLALASVPFANGQDDGEDEIFELSPFTVDAGDNQGYRATSTLAGTRIKTDLRDLGSAISVVTAEFLEDTGSTDAKNLLIYTTSTEVGGAYGSFGGEGASTANMGQHDNLRSDPGISDSSRVRGLSSASSTRNYFLSGFGFDSYNTDMVTISRGPNSILFGIGEPGGIVDSSLKQAVFGRPITNLSFRFGSEGSTRATLDLNRELIEGRLAIRFNSLLEDEKFQQKPAYEEDTRNFLTAKAILSQNENVDWLGQTTLSANYEVARREGTPTDPVPAQDRFSTWWEGAGSVQADQITGSVPNGFDPNFRDSYPSQWVIDAPYGVETTPGDRHAGQPHIWGAYVITYDGNGAPGIGINNADGDEFEVIDGTGGDFMLPDGSTAPGWYPLYSTESNNGPWGVYGGFQNHVLRPGQWDNENKLLQGHLAYANHDFDAYNVTLEQSFWDNKAGFEIAYDYQEQSTDKWFPLSNGRNSSIKIDTSVYLTNGARNPNVGRPLFSGQVEPMRQSWDTRTTKRATGYFIQDFTESDGWSKHLGKHTFTGLYTEFQRESTSLDTSLSWDTDHDVGQDFQSIVGKPGGWGGRMFFMGYIGDNQSGAATPADIKFYDNAAEFQLPQVGDFYNNYYFDGPTKTIKESTVRVRDIITGGGLSNQTIDSTAVTMQSKFLNNSLVTTFGWREDDSTAAKSDSVRNGYDNSLNVADTYANLRDTTFSGQTRTTQVVYHIPAKFTGDNQVSLHWSESENFNPASIRRDVHGADIGPPSGTTEEKGFSVSLLENRLHVKLNWYETKQKNKDNGNISGNMWGFNWPLSFADRWINAKNSFEKGEGVAFEDIGWGDPTDPNEVFEPQATGPYNSYDEVINALLRDVFPEDTLLALHDGVLPSLEGEPGTQLRTNNSNFSSLKSVADSVSEGFEVEAVYSITDNWRMAFNASKTEALFSNGLQLLTPWAEGVTAKLKANGMWDMYEGGASDDTTMGTRWTNEALTPLAAAQAKEGTLNSELRKWRWNMVTNYSFSEGKLKGLGVGGSLRWQDKVANGYPLLMADGGILIPDLDNPFFGSSEMNGDVWFSYKTKMAERPVKFQLNLQNVIGSDDQLAVLTNPDGQVAVFRNPSQKRWFFTTSVEF